MAMEEKNIKTDIRALCVTAHSFPEGIADAFEKIYSLVPSPSRMLIGLSRPNEEGNIIYKAGFEMLAGEHSIQGLEEVLIPAGNYLFQTITRYSENPLLIKNAFDKLLQDARLDPNGFCLELYVKPEEVWCMVPCRKKIKFWY
jgi:predicted transcriptional regulator YdeE